ncbi:MAG: hypothetical protein K0S26_3464 [Bacteroidota bacterium]|jgi:hypothetical protein|nr:hypothetical protein [Bacteroidota bacterium]
MKAITFIPNADNDKMIWIHNFSLKLPLYASMVGVSAAEVSSVQNDAAAFSYLMNLHEQLKQSLMQVTSYKRMMKHASGQQHLGPLPSIPILSNQPVAVPQGIFDRISKLVQRIKASIHYTTNMGADLGIISPNSKTDTSTLQPRLKIYMEAGYPRIKCSKGIAEALDLFVDRKDGKGFVLLNRLLIFDYLDMAALPTDNSLTEWNYKAMYVMGNDNVGLMSPVESVIVKRN